MADQIYRVVGPDGQERQISGPAGATDEQVIAKAKELFSVAPAAPATAMQKIQASGPMRLIQGARDSIDAGAQLLSRASPEWLTNTLDYIPSKLRNSDSPLVSSLANAYLADPRAPAIDKSIAQNEASLQAARKATGQDGFDGARLAGNIISPTNAAIAARLPVAAASTVPRMAAIGGLMGSAGGALTPVTDEAGQRDFASTKAIQTGVGAAAGAVLTPVIGKALQAVAPYVERAILKIKGPSEQRLAQASMETDNAIAQALRDIGQTIDDIPQQQLAALRQQVNQALVSGKKLDAAAALRKSDFEEAGLPYTQGQITRDPTQFANERNLRGVAGVGEPLMARFTGQNQQLQENIGLLARGASDRVTAGERLVNSLAGVDRSLNKNVNNAYGLARDSLGRAAPMDAAEFSRMANLSLDEQMAGGQLPEKARSILNDFALGKVPFNVNTAVQADKALSRIQRGVSKDEAYAVGLVRDSLNKAPIADNVGQDAKNLFDAARGLAKDRFSLRDAIPALKAAADGDISADDFVRKFVMTAPTDQVKKMAGLLDEPAKQEARSQIGATIQRAAFGENLSGDKLLAPERLAKAIRDIGPKKLEVFFSKAEVEKIQRMARVGSYINSTPAAAAVNTSNTASAAANLAGNIPGVGNKIKILAAVTQPILNQRSVNAAMNPMLQTTSQISPEAVRRSALASSLLGYAAGGAAGSSLGQ